MAVTLLKTMKNLERNGPNTLATLGLYPRIIELTLVFKRSR